MSFSMKERVAECYRRADEYRRLYRGASNLDERKIYLSAVVEFLRLANELQEKEFLSLANDIEKIHAGPKTRRSA
jgi:hypothetical protein